MAIHGPMIRANPLHAMQEKPIGAMPPPTVGGIKSVASMVGGPAFAQLGHFANPMNLMRGHNSNGSIHIKASHKGLLHKDLGVPPRQKIPASKLASAKRSSNPAVRKRATFAENAKKWNH